MAGALGLGIVGAAAGTAIILAAGPAGASGATVGAQLTLSGVATSTSPTGGSLVGVHPGDSVKFTPSAIPTAGLPAGLSDTFSSLLGTLSGFEVDIVSGNLPGVTYPVKLGACTNLGERPTLQVPFPTKNTYSFKYTVSNVALLCLYATQIDFSGAQIAEMTANNVKISTSNVYSGNVVVADDPPTGGISIQLPSVGITPAVGGVQLPAVNLPGTTVSVPALPGLSGGGTTTTPGGHKTTSGSLHFTPPPLTVPEQAMGGIGGGGGGFGGVAPDANSSTQLGNLLPDGSVANPANPQSTPGAVAKLKTTTKRVDLAANKAPAAQLPVLLAIIAIVALSLVTATYARLFLLRRNA